MTLVVREGVYEMLEYLASFCNLYAYSHGLKDYILSLFDQGYSKEQVESLIITYIKKSDKKLDKKIQN